MGHAFTLRSLEHVQSDATDDALWSAIRALDEKQMLLRHVADEQRRDGNDADAERLRAAADAALRHAELLRGLAESVPGSAGAAVAQGPA